MILPCMRVEVRLKLDSDRKSLSRVSKRGKRGEGLPFPEISMILSWNTRRRGSQNRQGSMTNPRMKPFLDHRAASCDFLTSLWWNNAPFNFLECSLNFVSPISFGNAVRIVPLLVDIPISMNRQIYETRG